MMIVFDSFFFLLGMQAVSLLQIDGKQTASGTDYPAMKPRKAAPKVAAAMRIKRPRMPINSKGIWRPLYTG